MQTRYDLFRRREEAVTMTSVQAERSATTLAQRWCALAVLHDRIEAHVERALQREHQLSVREFSLLEVLSRQHGGDGGHLQMFRVAEAVVLSQSATTRLVARLEDRGLLARYLCPTDRRGIYTDVTPAGLRLLEQARPTNDLAPFVEVIRQEAPRAPRDGTDS